MNKSLSSRLRRRRLIEDSEIVFGKEVFVWRTQEIETKWEAV